METIRDCLGLLLAPSETIPRVAQRGRLASALGVTLISWAAFHSAATWFTLGLLPPSKRPPVQLDAELIFRWALTVIVTTAVGCLLLYLSARILGGEGRLATFATVFGYIQIVFLPLGAFLALLAALHLPARAATPVMPLLVVWLGFLCLLAGKEVLKLSSGRALGAVLLAAAIALMMSTLARGPVQPPTGKGAPAPKAAPARPG